MFVAVALAFASGRANAGSSARSSEPPLVLFAGGITTMKVAGIITLSSAELFEPNRGSFVATGSMSVARTGHTATRLKNGSILIAGGSSQFFGGGTIFGSAELYDPSRRRFSNTGAMLEARTGHTATLLADGKVLIAGGDDGATSLSSSELYDPVSGEFAETGVMNIPRDNCTATRLANGKVLIAGGYQLLPDFSGSVQDTAEIYDPSTGSFSLTGSMNSARVSRGHPAARRSRADHRWRRQPNSFRHRRAVRSDDRPLQPDRTYDNIARRSLGRGAWRWRRAGGRWERQ